jgi:hypothetical protein
MFMVGFAIEASAELSIGVSLDLTIIRAGLKADIALFKLNIPFHFKYLTVSAPYGQTSCINVEPTLEVISVEVKLFVEAICGFEFGWPPEPKYCPLFELVLFEIGSVLPVDSEGRDPLAALIARATQGSSIICM